jgi:photosystem II stability/assembly factor-like uncharacterized protein
MSPLKMPAIAVALALAGGVYPANAAETVDGLASQTHIHGLAVDRQDPSQLFIATDGVTELISIVQDFMGFNAHPDEPGVLFASGHPAGGGNLGVIVSADGGRIWTEISPGLNGPVDFHQMTVSHADPDTIYGAFGALQVSRDGGKTWAMAGPVPERLIDLAASAKDPETLYAAKESGLSVSLDSGLTWKPLIEDAPVTMVETSADGTVYAFVFGRGLVSAKEGAFNFATLGGSGVWGEQYILHLAVDPTDARRLYAATGESEVLASGDGGATWAPLGQ